jgi:hypothetical protein
MKRKPWPYYRPIHHQVADKARSHIANSIFYGIILNPAGILVVLVLLYLFFFGA